MLRINVVEIVNAQQQWVEANFTTIIKSVGLAGFVLAAATGVWSIASRIRQDRRDRQS